MCDHPKVKSIRAKKKIAGLVFAYNSHECESCGAVLWRPETEEKFVLWLSEQKKKKPEKFVIQGVKLSQDLVDFAADLARRFGRTESDVYQACLALYFTEVDPEIKKVIESQTPKAPEVVKKFRVNPRMYVKVDANAQLFAMHMNEVASWVVQHVLTAAKNGFEKTVQTMAMVLSAA